MTASWTYGHYPPGKFPLLAFPAPSKRKAAVQSSDKGHWWEMSRKRGPEWRGETAERERDRHPPGLKPEELWCWVQGWDGTNFQTPGVLPPLSSSSHFSKEREKREKRRESGGGRKDVNENQTHSPVWSGREQWGGWCHKSGAGFSPYLFLRVAISPSTSVGPFFLHVSWFEILFLFIKKKQNKEK